MTTYPQEELYFIINYYYKATQSHKISIVKAKDGIAANDIARKSCQPGMVVRNVKYIELPQDEQIVFLASIGSPVISLR